MPADAASAPHPALRVAGVLKTFFRGTPDEVAALQAIDLVLTPGEWVTVVGSNGAGKSTLLSVIAGSQTADRGRVAIDGQDVTAVPEHGRARYVGRVSQDPRGGTAPNLTVEQNLALALLRGQGRGLRQGVDAGRRARFRGALEALGLGLEGRLSAPAGVLSGGQRQALTLVMATLVPPRLLLLDEHTASLDPRTAPAVMEITRRLVEAGAITTLMVTHNVEHAMRYGTRLVMMHAGQIVLDVAVAEKQALTVPALIARFEQQAADHLADDRLLLRP
jgi:putative tryptophan/tyrosine transport system ATP-binding protein